MRLHWRVEVGCRERAHHVQQPVHEVSVVHQALREEGGGDGEVWEAVAWLVGVLVGWWVEEAKRATSVLVGASKTKKGTGRRTNGHAGHEISREVGGANEVKK